MHRFRNGANRAGVRKGRRSISSPVALSSVRVARTGSPLVLIPVILQFAPFSSYHVNDRTHHNHLYILVLLVLVINDDILMLLQPH